MPETPSFVSREATLVAGESSDIFELSISSDRPAMGIFGDREILSHEQGAIDLSRVSMGAAPLLYNHATDLQLGVVKDAWIDSGKLRLRCQWDVHDEKVLPYFEKYQRGFLRNSSVRARILEYSEGRDEFGGYVKITRWEFMEASLLPLPEDPTVGVDRGLYQATLGPVTNTGDLPMSVESTTTEPPVDLEVVRTQAREEERARANFIEALGTKYQNPDLARQLIHENKTTDEARDIFAEYVFQRQVTAVQPQGTPQIGLSHKEEQEYSLLRAFHAAKTGDWSYAGLEREASQAIAQKLGKEFVETRGGKFFLPASDLTVNSEIADGLRQKIEIQRASLTSQATNIGNLIVTNFRSNDLINLGREMSLLARLGVPFLRGLTGIHEFPKQTAGLGFSWRATEITALTETNLAFSKASMSPKEFGGLFQYSKLAGWQAEIPMGLEQFARADFIRSLQTFYDDSLMNATGTGGQPRGLFNTPGLQALNTALGANGGTLNPERLKELITKIRTTWLAERGDLTMVTTYNYADWVSNQKDLNGRYVWDDDRLGGITAARPDRMWGIPVIDTAYVRSNFTKGTGTNLSGLVIGPFGNGSLIMGEWYGLQVDASPHFAFNTTQDVVRVIGTLDILVRNPETFAMVNEIVTV